MGVVRTVRVLARWSCPLASAVCRRTEAGASRSSTRVCAGGCQSRAAMREPGAAGADRVRLSGGREGHGRGLWTSSEHWHTVSSGCGT
jgi:hypothetical protein